MKRSAGVLLFRTSASGELEVLLGHMGGPFFAARDAGAWSIFKGEYGDGEEPLAVAQREFLEETGHPAPAGDYLALGDVKQANGKVVTAWAVRGELDPATAVSNTAMIEWPPRSGRMLEIPEIDRVAWFDVEAARAVIVRGQAPLLDRLVSARA